MHRVLLLTAYPSDLHVILENNSTNVLYPFILNLPTSNSDVVGLAAMNSRVHSEAGGIGGAVVVSNAQFTHLVDRENW